MKVIEVFRRSFSSLKVRWQHQCVCVGFALPKDPSSSETVEPEGSLNTPPDSGSPKHQFQEGAKDEKVS